MRDYKEQIDQLAGLMEEFKLAEASLNLSGFQITFRRQTKSPKISAPTSEIPGVDLVEEDQEETPVAAETPKGNPITSPMAGIYYLASNPGSPPFVKVGEVVTAGQTVGLIEAMKVFNEIPSPYSGPVLEILIETGSLVQPGDVLMRIG